MTPSLFDLPVRTSDAAELAYLIHEVAGSAPLSEELRARIAARGKTLTLPATVPYFGSLERDPIHSSAIYLAIDAIDSAPMLLRMAPASTPSSGIFPKAILIGRVRGPQGMELVIGAIPFAATDEVNVRTFAEQINPIFLPRPVSSNFPADLAEAANFLAFRDILRSKGQNAAFVKDLPTGMWGAIRAGWREGYVHIP